VISLKLANILTNIAEVKKSDPGGKEDVLSLMNAARTLRDDPVIMDRIIKGEEHGKLNGIDRYCYGLIKEYLEKGRIEEYDRLALSYSDDLIKFIRITGLGRKRIFSIYDYFRIKDINSLKCVFKGNSDKDIIKSAGLRKDLLTPLFLERIRWSLKYYEGLAGKTPRWPAEFFANKMAASLEKLKEVKKAQITGSIRRKESLIEDIDILVLPKFNNGIYGFEKSACLLKNIGKLPFIKKLISIKKEKNDISAIYGTIYEINAEIIIAGDGTWSRQLFKTTGSRKHLFKLKEYAKANSIPYPDRTASADLNSEEDIYRSLGLDHIAVELRQGRDEIELSSKNRLPDLVKMEDIRGDLHIHSKWSDGLIEYSGIIDSAKKQNYEYIALSDHSVSNYYGNGLDAERLLAKMSFMKELRKEYDGIDILMGGEIDIRKPGVFDYPPEIIRKLDIAIASLHSSFTNSARQNTDRAVSALEEDYFDLLAHPTGNVFGNRAPLFIDIDRIIEASAKYGKALEINSYYMRMDLDEDNARKAKEAGSMLAVNTDTHRPGNMEMMQLGVDLARRAGLEAKDIINTMTAEELKIWRKNRKKTGRFL